MLRTHLWLSLMVLLAQVPAVADEPTDVAGTWTWSWKDAQGTTHTHVLDVEKGAKGELAARERYDDLEAVKVDDLKVNGKDVTFSVKRGERHSSYSGKLADGDTINGKVMVTVNGGQAGEYGWTATRKPVKEKTPEVPR